VDGLRAPRNIIVAILLDKLCPRYHSTPRRRARPYVCSVVLHTPRYGRKWTAGARAFQNGFPVENRSRRPFTVPIDQPVAYLRARRPSISLWRRRPVTMPFSTRPSRPSPAVTTRFGFVRHARTRADAPRIARRVALKLLTNVGPAGRCVS